MIVTRLLGGLGNQLFQYACGLYLAERSGQELVLDTSAFDDYKLHALAIQNFAITARLIDSRQQRRVPGRYRGHSRIRESFAGAAQWLLPRHQRSFGLRREKPFGFNSRYLQHGEDLYLDGYWQSERFFPGMRSRLQEEFQLAKPLSSESSFVADQIAESASVALHVRRGDYVTDKQTQKIYRSLDAQYYRACLNDIHQHVHNAKVFVFSNDIPWCIEHLDVGIPFVPVTHNDAATAFEDLFLISRCRHKVIANSSFSWWGAFLSANRCETESVEENRVYCPDPWFNAGTLDGSAICCDKWIRESSLSGNEVSHAA